MLTLFKLIKIRCHYFFYPILFPKKWKFEIHLIAGSIFDGHYILNGNEFGELRNGFYYPYLMPLRDKDVSYIKSVLINFKRPPVPQVLKSKHGFYLGTLTSTGQPCSRLSVEYWKCECDAKVALATNEWEFNRYFDLEIN